MELYNCWIGEQSSQILFEKMTNLRVLKIGIQMKDESMETYICRTLFDAVSAACGQHLQVLSLTMGWDVGVWSITKPIRNMSEFKSLRDVEFDTSLFWEKDWGQEDCDDEDESDENEGNEGNEDNGTDIKSNDNVEEKKATIKSRMTTTSKTTPQAAVPASLAS